MFCRWCGKELAAGAMICSACGKAQEVPPPPPSGDPIDRVVAEARRTARELADATEKFSRKAVHEAKRAADDPSGTARRAVKRLEKEIQDAKRDLEKALHDIE